MSSSECFVHTRTLQIAWARDHLTAVTPAAALPAKIVTVGPAEPEKPGGFFSSSFISVTFITYFITEPPQHPKTKTRGRSSTVEPAHLLTAPFQHKPKQEWGGPSLVQYLSLIILFSGGSKSLPPAISCCLPSWRCQGSPTVWTRTLR